MDRTEITVVVFDCDGVLIESNEVKAQAFGNTVAEYGSEAADKLMVYHAQNGGISRFKKFEWFFAEVLKKPLTDELMDQLCDRFTELCLTAVKASPMVPGAREVLDRLDGKLPMFVASGTPQAELEKVLEAKGLARYFKAIAGTPPEKAHLLADIISSNNLDPAHVLMVGDSTTDLEAAQVCNTQYYGRGEMFESFRVPWGTDLTGLPRWLDSRIR